MRMGEGMRIEKRVVSVGWGKLGLQGERIGGEGRKRQKGGKDRNRKIGYRI